MNNATKMAVFLLTVSLMSNVAAQDVPGAPGPAPRAPIDKTGDFSGLPLDLLPPGARALGLGGAFTAVADDATAALANPAGLTNLSAAEVSVHFRNSDADVVFLDTDAYNSALFLKAGALNKTYSDSGTDISFASFVVPFENVTISGFYSSRLDFDAAQSEPDELSDSFWLDDYTNINLVEATIESYGLSAAFRWTDRLSMGLTVKNAKLNLQSEDIWQVDYFNDFEFLLEGLYGSGSAVAYQGVYIDFYDFRAVTDDSDSDVTFDLGLLFKGEKWSVGAVYRQGAEFKVNGTSIGTGTFECVGNVADPLVQDCQDFDSLLQDIWMGIPETEGNWRQAYYQDLFRETEAEIKVPDILTLGVAWRPVQTFLVSLDINRVAYSDLVPPRKITQGFGLDVNNVNQRSDFFEDGSNIAFADIDGFLADHPFPFVEKITDETTFNLGVEKFFTFQSGILRTLALRGGAFTVKDHDGNVLTNNDETVWTVGLGSTWGAYGGDKAFQLDLAASFADNTTNVILSGIFRF